MIHVSGQHKWRRFYVGGQLLDLATAQRIQHCELEFDWGPGGNPPAMRQLAIGVLYELTGDKGWSILHAADLVDAWVSKLSEDFTAWSKLDEWVIDQGGSLRNSYKLGVV